MDDDSNDFEDEYVEEESEAYVSLSSRDCCLLYLLQFTLNDFLIILCLKVGDGGAGGGISLAGTWWDKEALAIAEDVCLSFDGDLKIYAFRTLPNSTIKVRIEKMSNK